MELKTEGLAALGITTQALVNQIVEKISEEILDEIRGDIFDKVTRILLKKMDSQMDNLVEEAANKTFLTAYQPIDEWGEAKGEKAPLKEHFKRYCLKFWEQEVDDEGKPSRGWGCKPRAEYYAQRILAEVLNKDLKQQVDKVLKSTSKEIKVHAAAFLQKFITEKLCS